MTLTKTSNKMNAQVPLRVSALEHQSRCDSSRGTWMRRSRDLSHGSTMREAVPGVTCWIGVFHKQAIALNVLSSCSQNDFKNYTFFLEKFLPGAEQHCLKTACDATPPVSEALLLSGLKCTAPGHSGN